MYSSYIHLIDWCRHQKSFWYMLDIFWWQKMSRPFPCYVPPTSTYLSFCASLCRRVVECSFWWRSFVRMKSSSYTGRSILYVSWDSTSGWATASSCSITEAFQCLLPIASEWCSQSLFRVWYLHNFNGCQFHMSVQNQGKEERQLFVLVFGQFEQYCSLCCTWPIVWSTCVLHNHDVNEKENKVWRTQKSTRAPVEKMS